MIDRVHLKGMAKEQIKGNLPVLFLCLLIIGVASGIVSMVPVLGVIVVAIATPAIMVGYLKIFLNLTYGEKPQIETLFSGLPNFIKAFLIELLMGVYVFLWTLLLIVPGIIKAISYMFSLYILAENPDVGVKEALELSKKITDGHKKDLFVLGLSFILWGLLCMVTFGIAIVYVGPYVQATMMNAYNELKGAAGIGAAVVTDAASDDAYEQNDNAN